MPTASMNRKATKYRVPALEKGLDILEALAYHPGSLSLTELARALGRSSSELFRMLTCLEQRGYIKKDQDSGQYALSLKLYELAHTHPPVEHLLEAATRPMQRLAQSLRESCHLSVLHQGRLVVLKEVLSPGRVRLSVAVGGRFSPIHTVSGRLLLAQMQEETLAAFLEASDEYAALSAQQKEAFHAKLAEIRQSGYSTATDESYLGVCDAAVLVGNPRVKLSAALAVASLKATADPEHFETIATQLKRCAQNITHAMGLDHDDQNHVL